MTQSNPKPVEGALREVALSNAIDELQTRYLEQARLTSNPVEATAWKVAAKWLIEAELEAALSAAPEMTADQMLEHVRGSLRGYPNCGGDIIVMQEVDRIVREAAAPARDGVRPQSDKRPWFYHFAPECQFPHSVMAGDPNGPYNSVCSSVWDNEPAIQAMKDIADAHNAALAKEQADGGRNG